ncbi:MAG: sel1 repeat family protein [Clostridia bacterium]|nr:sel1 repeat family protein [Clostridia bacterium]
MEIKHFMVAPLMSLLLTPFAAIWVRARFIAVYNKRMEKFGDQEAEIREEIDTLLENAKNGDADACYILACRYRDGSRGFQRSKKLRDYWFREAIQGCHPDALAEACWDRMRLRIINPIRVKDYLRAAPCTHEDYTGVLFSLYEGHNGKIKLDESVIMKGMQAFEPLAESGNAAAQMGMSFTLMQPNFVNRDMKAGFDWAMKAAQAGDILGERMVGLYLLEGMGAEKNADEACEWLKKAEAKGDKAAAKALKRIEKLRLKNELQ